MGKMGTFAVATALFVSVATSAGASEYYVDPSAGGAGDGSEGNPWDSLQDAIDAGDVVAGDTVWLMSGDHGALRIEAAHNLDTITIAAADGQEPRFTSVLVRNSSAWTLRGLHVVGESADYLIDIAGDSEGVAVESCVLMSTADASGWSAQDWINRASSGISVDGTRMTIRNNLLMNVGYGISVSADHSLVEGNLIENFSRDGLRGLGDYSVFQYNTVKNCYAVDDHHDDGFQSWSVGEGGVGTGEVVGIVLRGNTFINYEDPNQPHRGTLQGIGCFDGTFVDWVVENNVVITDHWHGITLLGARNSIVINNTVIDPNQEEPGPPWISIDDHKDGTPPDGVRRPEQSDHRAQQLRAGHRGKQHHVRHGRDGGVFRGLRRLRPSPARDGGRRRHRDGDRCPRARPGPHPATARGRRRRRRLRVARRKRGTAPLGWRPATLGVTGSYGRLRRLRGARPERTRRMARASGSRRAAAATTIEDPRLGHQTERAWGCCASVRAMMRQTRGLKPRPMWEPGTSMCLAWGLYRSTAARQATTASLRL